MAGMPKELIKDPRTGKLREPTQAEVRRDNAATAAIRRRNDEALQRQENMDRLVMSKGAADKKWSWRRQK